MPEKSLTPECSSLGMEIVHGTEPQLQHLKKKEVEQIHEPSDDSAEPSNDSAEPSNDSAEPSNDSAEPSNDSAEPLDDSAEPSNDSAEPSNYSASLQHQHLEKKEVEQIHEPSDDSAEPSNDRAEPSDDSAEPLNDSAEPSGDNSNPSYDSSEQSGDNSKLSSRPSSADRGPSGDSSESVSDSQPEPEIGESTLSESEYSSTESGKRERRTQTLNQVINENVSNTEELSIPKIISADQLFPEIPYQQLGSSAKGDDLGRGLSTNNLNSDKIISETPHDVSQPTLESSIEGSQVDTRSISSGSSDSTENSTLDPAKSSSQRLYPSLPTFEPSTSGQDFTKSGSMDQVDHNQNNSSLSTHNPESEAELLAGESVNSSEPESQSLWIKDASIYLTLVLLIAVLYSMLLSSTPSSDDSPLEKFSTYVHEIKLIFPSQDHKFWKTLEASSHRILKKDVSKYPAVILMASSLKHASVALGIARNISSAFDLSVGLSSDSPVIDVKDYKHLSAAEQKLQLYNVLDSILGTVKRRSVVLENLQFLDPLAAVLFYNYCDNDYAPFKDVLIILNLYFDDEKEKIDDPIAVENYLEMIWNKGLASDKVKPLLSRVANHIVIVQGEGPDVK